MLIAYDEVLGKIGQFGIIQKKNLFFLSFVSAAGGLGIVVFVFTGFEQNYSCMVPLCEDGDHLSYFQESACNRSLKECDEEPRLPAWYGEKGIERNNRCRNVEVMEGKCTVKKTKWRKDTEEDHSLPSTCDLENFNVFHLD